MKKLLMIIGEIVFILILFAIPIVTGISFALQYNAYIRIFLTAGTGLEMIMLFMDIYFRVIAEDN